MALNNGQSHTIFRWPFCCVTSNRRACKRCWCLSWTPFVAYLKACLGELFVLSALSSALLCRSMDLCQNTQLLVPRMGPICSGARLESRAAGSLGVCIGVGCSVSTGPSEAPAFSCRPEQQDWLQWHRWSMWKVLAVR